VVIQEGNWLTANNWVVLQNIIFAHMFNRRMEKISWTDHVRNEEVLLRAKEQRNILHEISKRKANWIGHILWRNCLLQQVIEGKIKGGIKVTGRRGRRRRKLLDDLKERRGYSYLKEEALDRTMWRAHFGRGFGPVMRQTAKWMNMCIYIYIYTCVCVCVCVCNAQTIWLLYGLLYCDNLLINRRQNTTSFWKARHVSICTLLRSHDGYYLLYDR
jgi:hypothetical protein